MSRHPTLFILGMVTISMAIAVFYNKNHKRFFQATDNSVVMTGQADLSSEGDPISILSPLKAFFSEEMGSTGLRTQEVDPNHDYFKCQCATAAVDNPNFSFETEDKCGEDRMYLENQLSQIPAVYKNKMATSNAEFPRLCLTYILRRSFPKSDQEPKPYFAKCEDPNGLPVRGNKKPCVTENYVNVIYNTFADVLSCMGVPQKDIIPKLYQESGFHLNAVGAGFDSGIGQLTGAAIADINEQFNFYKKKLMNSEKQSCKNLKPMFEKLKVVPLLKVEPLSNRCGLMSPPTNPAINLFYLSVKYLRDRYAIKYYMEKYQVEELMSQVGIQGYEKDQLNQMLSTLAFNAGAAKSVIYLKNYLQTRWEAMQTGEGEAPTKEDFNFKVDVSSFKDKKPDEVNVLKMSYPAYLMIFQDSGAKGYLSYIAQRAKNLNEAFKEGTCVPESYLSL